MHRFLFLLIFFFNCVSFAETNAYLNQDFEKRVQLRSGFLLNALGQIEKSRQLFDLSVEVDSNQYQLRTAAVTCREIGKMEGSLDNLSIALLGWGETQEGDSVVAFEFMSLIQRRAILIGEFCFSPSDSSSEELRENLSLFQDEINTILSEIGA